MAAQRRRMSDIARLAGVSSSAVSFALNGRPGVSHATRARILDIATQAGWYPSAAARALTGARSSAVGLVLTRPPRELSVHPFQLSFISGLEAELSGNDYSLLLHVAANAREESARYRRWWSEGRVDGVVLLDLRVNDPRPAELRDIGLPFAVVGDPAYADDALAIWTDDASAVRAAVERLVALGHTRLARVAERTGMAHTVVRTRAFLDACAAGGLTSPRIAEAAGESEAEAATADLLSAVQPPTAILYDSDLMAMAGLRTAKSLGVRVPAELSIIAYDDSLLCEVTEPPLSALSHDVYRYGGHVARALAAVMAGDAETRSELDSVPELVERGSTGPAPS